jgi:hypothetical protein
MKEVGSRKTVLDMYGLILNREKLDKKYGPLEGE